MGEDYTNWCLGYLEGMKIVSISKKALISEFLADLKWFDIDLMESEEMVKLEGILAKWEDKLK